MNKYAGSRPISKVDITNEITNETTNNTKLSL